MIKFPDITVKLIDEDGNAFFIIGRVIDALKKHHVSQFDIDNYIQQVMVATNNDLMRITRETVNCI